MKKRWQFLSKLLDFWSDNLERNVKRISIAVGAFIVYGIVTIPIDPVWKGAIVTLGSIIVMSIFGKNGNGREEEEIGEEAIKSARIKLIKQELEELETIET
ncbi:unnamed protein product [marine sediment metagenome]|uniref:Uncharacterized protein n=1 Tax=marine sediment metagenome TaxID=412755 RepID=X1FXC1_9ZZZZ